MAHSNWIEQAAGTSCPAPMTRAALLALRAASALSPTCHYVITDHVQNRLVAGTAITLHAVAPNELSEMVHVNTTYDNEAWAGRYNIDLGQVIELEDNLNNRVTGATAAANFDWGNAVYSGNVVDNATLTVTYGALQPVSNNYFHPLSTTDLTGRTGGSFTRNEVFGAVNLSLSNLPVTQTTIGQGATLNAVSYAAAGTGVARSDILTGSSVTFAAGSGAVFFVSNKVTSAGVVNHTGAGALSISNTSIEDAGSVTHSSPLGISMSGCKVFGTASAVDHAAGTLNLQGTRVGPYGRVLKSGAATGAMTLNYCAIDTVGVVNQLALGTFNATGMRVAETGNVTTQAGSNSPVTINYTTVSGVSTVRVQPTSTAGTLTLSNSFIGASGLVDKAGTGNFALNSTNVDNNGQAALTGVRSATLTGCRFSGTGRFTGNSTAGAGVTDSVIYSSVTDYGLIQFTATGAAPNAVNYCSVRGLTGSISVTGTNTGLALSRTTVDNGNVTFTNNVALPTLLDIGIRDQGVMTVSGCTAGQDIRYTTVQSAGRLFVTNKAAATQIFYVDVSAAGTLTTQGAALSCTYVTVSHGGVNHNGGTLSYCAKTMQGTLITGAFPQSNIQHHVAVGKTLTTANASRADYQGLAAQLV